MEVSVIHAPKQKAQARYLKTLGFVELELSTSIGINVYDFPKLSDLSLYYNGSWIADGLLKNTSNNLLRLAIAAFGEISTLDDVVLDMRDYPFYEHLQDLELYGDWPEHVALRAYHFPQHLTFLSLGGCTLNEDPMPELEKLHNHETLYLFCPVLNCGSLTCSAGGFPQLQMLRLLNHSDRVQEFSIAPGAMPMLKQLEMTNFGGLRNNVPELQNLKMLRHFEWRSAPFNKEQFQASSNTFPLSLSSN